MTCFIIYITSWKYPQAPSDRAPLASSSLTSTGSLHVSDGWVGLGNLDINV